MERSIVKNRNRNDDEETIYLEDVNPGDEVDNELLIEKSTLEKVKALERVFRLEGK